MTSWQHRVRDLLIPDEWQSLPALARDLSKTVCATSHAFLKQVVGFALPFSMGMVLGYHVAPLSPESGAALVRGLLSFSGLLSGFMVTLMLFTGRTEKAESLSLEAAKTYREKVIYLLWSQTQTLAFGLLTALLSIAWMVTDDTVILHAGITIALFGFFGVAVTRLVLLPFQIFDLHQFALDQMVEEKVRDAELKAQMHIGED